MNISQAFRNFEVLKFQSMPTKLPLLSKYGKFTTIGKPFKKKNIYYLKVKCDCGNIRDVQFYKLRVGLSKCCGCASRERCGKMATVHGLSRHPLFHVWQSMNGRCYNPKNYAYKYYGGRGISVCQEWRNDFMPFYNWAISEGWILGKSKKEQQLDRIDNDGNYEPSNCRFTTSLQNVWNRRNVKLSLEKAREIRRLRLEGSTYTSLAELFSVDKAYIWRILKNQIWKE